MKMFKDDDVNKDSLFGVGKDSLVGVVTFEGWTRSSPKGIKKKTDGVGYAYISDLEKNTEYTISVYQYISKRASHKLRIGNENSMQNFHKKKSFYYEATVENEIFKSDGDGKIVLEFYKTNSTPIFFSGLSISRT